MAGAVAVIGRLVAAFETRVWLVSKCGPRVQARTERWLAAHGFFERTGLREQNVWFCQRRADKRQLCIELGLTHFVDDRLEVHAAIREAVAHQFRFGRHDGPVPGYVTPVSDWQQAEPAILATFA